MRLHNILKSNSGSNINLNSPNCYADSSTIAPDERPYYQPDNYYTFYSYPGTMMAKRVVPFEERKAISYPSARGLYVGEILLLEYCSYGHYPKPESGYPGFWWFQYGIRDVGHALESLKIRGFIKWGSKTENLVGLKTDVLKQILTNCGLSASGKKQDLIERIRKEIPDDKLIIPRYVGKYALTDTGKKELEENGYVPYMHKNNRTTTEDAKFGETFNVWDINKHFPDGNATNWRQIVGNIEKRLFGTDMANGLMEKKTDDKIDYLSQRDEMRKYLFDMKDVIQNGIKASGNGFEEEIKGIDLIKLGKDKEALINLYISIGKKFDAPALYREIALLLHKYGMYEEELSIIDIGINIVPTKNVDYLIKLKEKAFNAMKKEDRKKE